MDECMLYRPSNTRRPRVGFRAARQRRCKILLLRLVCGVCAARQIVLIFVASRQKHAPRGIELILFLTPDAWYWPSSKQRRWGGGGGGELLRPHIETSKLAVLNEENNLKLSQLQNALLLLAFSSFSNVAASTPAAKQHQSIVIIGGFAG